MNDTYSTHIYLSTEERYFKVLTSLVTNEKYSTHLYMSTEKEHFTLYTLWLSFGCVPYFGPGIAFPTSLNSRHSWRCHCWYKTAAECPIQSEYVCFVLACGACVSEVFFFVCFSLFVCFVLFCFLFCFCFYYPSIPASLSANSLLAVSHFGQISCDDLVVVPMMMIMIMVIAMIRMMLMPLIPSVSEVRLFVCWLVAYRPSNMLVYLRDGSAQTTVRAARLK